MESVRQPFYAAWLAVVGFLLCLNPFLAAYTFGDDNLLVTTMGLSMLLVGGLVLAAFTASGVIGREIENKTALTVITKPLARPVFVLGKFLGVLAGLLVAWWIWTLIYLLAWRQGAFSSVSIPWDWPVIAFGLGGILLATVVATAANYFFGKPFGGAWTLWLAIIMPLALLAASPFDHAFAVEPTGELFDPRQWLASFMIFQATTIFAAVAVAASTRLGQAATLTAILVVFFLGLASDYAFGRRAADAAEAGQTTWATFAYAGVPNLQFLWLGDAMIGETIDNVGPGFVLLVSGYTVLLTVGILGLAVALFQTRNAA